MFRLEKTCQGWDGRRWENLWCCRPMRKSAWRSWWTRTGCHQPPPSWRGDSSASVIQKPLFLGGVCYSETIILGRWGRKGCGGWGLKCKHLKRWKQQRKNTFIYPLQEIWVTLCCWLRYPFLPVCAVFSCVQQWFGCQCLGSLHARRCWCMWLHMGAVRTQHESLHWKLTLGEKSLVSAGNWTCISIVPGFAVWCPTSWAVSYSMGFME